MREIAYQESDRSKAPYPVTNGSLVVLEMRNIGWQPIREAGFDQQQDFTLRFPGRKVVHFKVRILTSPAVTRQLRDTSFIACSDLGGSKLSAACAKA